MPLNKIMYSNNAPSERAKEVLGDMGFTFVDPTATDPFYYLEVPPASQSVLQCKEGEEERTDKGIDIIFHGFRCADAGLPQRSTIGFSAIHDDQLDEIYFNCQLARKIMEFNALLKTPEVKIEVLQSKLAELAELLRRKPGGRLFCPGDDDLAHHFLEMEFRDWEDPKGHLAANVALGSDPSTIPSLTEQLRVASAEAEARNRDINADPKYIEFIGLSGKWDEASNARKRDLYGELTPKFEGRDNQEIRKAQLTRAIARATAVKLALVSSASRTHVPASGTGGGANTGPTLKQVKNAALSALKHYSSRIKVSWCGHHHEARVCEVMAVIRAAESIPQIDYILAEQHKLFVPTSRSPELVAGIAELFNQKKKDNDQRWRTLDKKAKRSKVVNPDNSGYVKAIRNAMDEIEQLGGLAVKNPGMAARMYGPV